MNEAPMRFVMIGGFLGAGKTTAIGKLAQRYQQQGLNVGIVTNDQATDLVDTNSLASQGFAVGEVAGACFCCNFNELTRTVSDLEQARRPDIILAEPVGSCTDLVATVIQPLRRLYEQRFDVAPYAVLLKPSHGRKILKNEAGAGFSPKAAYIFKKQLEEADVVVLNRIDELPTSEVDELAALIEQERPGLPLLRMSAKTGQGLEGLCEFLEQRGGFGQRILELDYDIYAEGEAELGWLNSSLRFQSGAAVSLDQVLMSIIQNLRDSLASEQAETAHLKTIGLSDGAYGVANLVSSDSPPELSIPSHATVREAQVIVNARVALAPEVLTQHVEKAVATVAGAMNLTTELGLTQSFRPGRPVPTHRYADAK